MSQQLISVLQSNTIGIILMIITLSSLIKNLESGVIADKVFFLLTFSIMVVCFVEILTAAVNGTNFVFARELNIYFNSVLFAVNPIPAFLWAVYCQCKIFQSEHILKKSLVFLVIPLFTVVCLSFANIFTDIFFSISSENLYQREKYFIIATSMSVLYLIYVIVIIIINRKTIAKKLYFPLLSFMILPTFGIAIQFFYYGFYTLWVSAAISVIIIFNHVQSDYTITDWLTGLYNRKQLDSYMQQMCRRKRDNLFAGIMMDMDYFKFINDNYGHLEGDNVLRNVAKILKKTAGAKACVARYAGDEFVIMGEFDSEEQIKEKVNQIQHETSKFNNSSEQTYNLSISVGYAIFKGANCETPDEFLSRMDNAMYAVKIQKHRAVQQL